MPKMKTNAAAKKRFTFTGTGKIKRKHAYHSHILTKKTKKVGCRRGQDQESSREVTDRRTTIIY